jgi:uncharacterized protein
MRWLFGLRSSDDHYRNADINGKLKEMKDFLGREILETFLLSDAAPQDGMSFFELDGFLTGLASGPTVIPSEEWLPLLWRQVTPQYRNGRESQLIRNLILRHYEAASRALAAPDEESDLLAIEDFEERMLMASAWSDGFLQAIELRPDSWLPLIQDREGSKLLQPLLLLYREVVEEFENSLSDGLRRAVLSAAAEQIPGCGHAIKQFWNGRARPETAQTRNGASIAIFENLRPSMDADHALDAGQTAADCEAVMFTTTSGVIVSVNENFTAITGFPAEEALGKTPRILKSPLSESPEHSRFWRELNATGRWHGSVWNQRRDGTFIKIRQTVSTVKNTRNEPLAYVSVFQEIERRQSLSIAQSAGAS